MGEDSTKNEYALAKLDRFQYGDLFYIPEKHSFVKLPRIPLSSPIKSISEFFIAKARIPDFLFRFRPWCEKNGIKIQSKLPNLIIYRDHLDIAITTDAINRDWCWISMRYPLGKSSLSILDILKAKEKNIRYLQTETGWIDTEAPHLKEVSDLVAQLRSEDRIDKEFRLKLSRLELLRLTATTLGAIQVNGTGKKSELLKNIIHLRPNKALPELGQYITSLRKYQTLGVAWLRFLYENKLGGLLCDDMGLGKTHQVMALMALNKKLDKEKCPVLIVCPTSVIHHWYEKIKVHAKGLKPALYHQVDRNLKDIFKNCDVLITSYGILRNDIQILASCTFSLAVFDEAQYLKNGQTYTHKAAHLVQTNVKIGLTGTPIENHISELKALFNLVLPGYLGTDKEFERKYASSSPTGIPNPQSVQWLKTMVSPFVLRRMKEAVLDELPEKIEDIRSCYLSEDQTKLYRQTIASKGKNLRSALESDTKRIPYIHIFALLMILKQICDHPAIVAGKIDDYDNYKSGKWDLFKEIVQEALDSGQKIVVFSQFLDMIRIIERYLTENKVGFVTLTGSTRNRGKIISKFNDDENCRVFIGSLMAGGTGIDLIAGSVVIHYDRWWNAAREDQATDRLHRIGQKKVVQVFKLVTKGTLEEKIAAIIEKKRALMNSVIKDDDPNVLKSLDRNELLSLLSAPKA